MKRSLFLLTLLAALQTNAATLYVRSTDGSDADNGTTWALAKATLVGAFTIAAAGDRIWVSDNHAETQATAMTLTSPGTAAAPCEVLCGDDAAEPPTALATTATITTTGSSSLMFAGFAYYFGIAFNCSSGAASSGTVITFGTALPSYFRFDSCSLNLLGTTAGQRIGVGDATSNSDDQLLQFLNSTITFGAIGQQLIVRSRCEIIGGSIAASGSVPTTLFSVGASAKYGSLSCIGVNLSTLGSGKNLVDVSSAFSGIATFTDCKLGFSVSITTGSVSGQGGTEVTVINCDSADTNYRYYRRIYPGTITHETTIIRTGGASDGTTGFSRKMVTTANSKFYSPLESQPIEIWNETAGSVTVTIYGLCLTLPTDAQSWVSVRYPGTSSFPLSLTSSDSAANLIATPVSQSTDTSAWDGSSSLWARTNSAVYTSGQFIKLASNPGRVFQCTTSGTAAGSEPAGYASAVDGDAVTDNTAVFTAMYRFKMDTTFTTTGKGMLYARVNAASPGTVNTIFYDPMITDGLRQYMTTSGVANEGVGSGSTGGSYTFGQ